MPNCATVGDDPGGTLRGSATCSVTPVRSPTQRSPKRTAASGPYILAGWIAHGGVRRLRAGGTGLSPAVIFGHFALAAAGLLVLIGYLATDEAGLGCGRAAPAGGRTRHGHGDHRAVPRGAVGSRATQAAPARPRMPVLVIVGHGLLAVGTMLLVLLAALGASGS